MTASCIAPETAEVAVCGHTEYHGGRYEWTCVRPVHDENSSVAHNHVMLAFPRVKNED